MSEKANPGRQRNEWFPKRVWWVVEGNGRDRCHVQASFGGNDVLKLIVGMGELVTESGQTGWHANEDSGKLLSVKRHESNSEKMIPFSIQF